VGKWAAARLIVFAFLLFAPTACAPNYRALTNEASALGAACIQAAAQFAVTLTPEARREVLNQLTALNDALIETAGYEREARRTNSVDLIDANRAFLETGRAWGICSLEYNKVLVAIGERACCPASLFPNSWPSAARSSWRSTNWTVRRVGSERLQSFR